MGRLEGYGSVLEFLTIYGGKESSRNKVVVPARQDTQPGGIGSLESIFGLLIRLKIRALDKRMSVNGRSTRCNVQYNVRI